MLALEKAGSVELEIANVTAASTDPITIPSEGYDTRSEAVQERLLNVRVLALRETRVKLVETCTFTTES